MKKLSIILLLLSLIALNVNAQSTFKASKDARNQVTFESDAPLENIVGVSNNIEVTAMIDPNNVSSNAMGKVVVDLRTLKTGINLRDEHLNSKNWLYTEKYPHAVFKLKSITGASASKLADGQKVNVKLNGTLTIHGVTKGVSVPAELTYFKESAKTKSKIAGNLLKTRATFNIKLSDYGINIPSMVVGKVDENIRLTANFIASDAGAMMGNPCGGCNPCGASATCNPCGAKKGKCNPCGVK